MDLNTKTVTELRTIAAELEISGRSKMKKAELVAVIERYQMDQRWNSPEVVEEAPEVFASIEAPEITTPTRTKAMITRDVPGAAFFNISDGPSGVIVRYGRVFELVTGSGETITVRARTMVKAVKRLAVKLGIHLDAIDTVKLF